MVKEIDAREHVDRIQPARQAALHAAAEEVSDELAGEERVKVVSFDARSGNAAVVVTESPEPGPRDYVRRALTHVQQIGRALGLAPEQPPEFVADPEHQTTSSGAVAVHLQQQYKGIPLYEATETVRFDPDGRLTEVAGRTHTVERDLQVAPVLTAEEGLRRAAAYVAQPDDEPATDPFGQSLAPPTVDLADFEPVVTTVHAGRSDRAVTFHAEPFEGPVTVSLLWFPIGETLRLSWHMVLGIPAGPQYRVLVDAADGQILLCRQLAWTILGRARVFLRDGGTAPETVQLPLPLDRYPVTAREAIPAGFPDDWLVDDSTDGANARVRLADGRMARARRDGSIAVFDPTPGPQDDDQLIVNLLAFCGLMHDVLYVLGFREADGNFQRDNRGRGGLPADPVRATVYPAPVWGTANMRTPPDGTAPEMNMGLVASTGRHTALDGDVVMHEYTHGLTERLVGGPLDTNSLDGPQSSGMGEGWGDYMACVLNGRETVGSWVVNRSTGIRRFRYDEDYPGTYADLGHPDYSEVHDIGELWCATLLAVNRRIGTTLGAQLVVDALKLSASNPSLLAMRDAILVAARDYAAQLDEADRENLTYGIWEAFARFGMGPGARTNGDTLTGIEADFTPPPRPEAAPTWVTGTALPELPIPDDDPSGVVSTVSLAASGTIVVLEASVDISHTYRGDLVVELIAPGGERVTLHDREGGRQDDLRAMWSSETDERLGALVGRPVAGAWQLHVADVAAVDEGTLHSWNISTRVAESRPVAGVQVRPALDIPDDDPTGVTSTATLSATGTIRRLTLDLDLTHTYVGDLVVTLGGPSGRKVTVHDRAGLGQDNLIRSWTSDGDGPLAEFVGEVAGGEWSLHVQDLEGADRGKLNRWSLEVET